MKRLTSSLTLALAASPALLVAQGVTTGALTGTVRSAAGAALAGARVRISAAVLMGGERVAQSDATGAFRFPALPPGTYTVDVEAAGMVSMRRQVQVALGGTAVVQFRMSEVAAATVEVTASGVTEEPTSVTTTQNFRTEAIDNLPIRRDLAAIAALAPGVNLSQGSSTRVSATAFGGDRDNANAYLINGVNVGDPSTGQQWVQVNPDWFEEVQVGGVGAGAEFGGFSGGYFNGLIKKGGNTLTGTLTGYTQSASWSAVRTVSDGSGRPLAISANKGLDMGLTLGGPIVKDRLWYFLSLEQVSTERFPAGSPVGEKRTVPRIMGNFTYQPNPSSTLTVFMDYDRVKTDHRGASRDVEAVATTLQESPSFTYGLEWLQQLSSTTVFTLRASGFTGKDDRTAYAGETYPLYVDGGVPNRAAYGSQAGFVELNNAYQVSNDRRTRMGVVATLDWFGSGLITAGDSHAVRLGLDMDRATDEERLRFPGNRSLNAVVNEDTGAIETDFIQVGGGYQIDTTLRRTAAFLQDTWMVNSRLTLRPGVRFEKFQGGDLWNASTVAPRLGLTLHMDERHRTAIKAHWGRYFDGLSVAYFDRALPGAYPKEDRYYWGNYEVITDPRNPLASAPLTLGSGDYWYSVTEASRIDPDVKQPYFDEAQVALEFRIGETWTLGLSGVQRKGKDLLVRKDMAPVSATSTVSVTNPLTGQVVAFAKPATTPDFLITNDADARRTYKAYTFSFDGKLTRNWDLAGSYTRAENKGNLQRSNGYNSRFEWSALRWNAEGDLPGTARDEFKLRSGLRLPGGFAVSGSFAFLSGMPGTRFTRLSRQGNRGNWARDIYLEPLGSTLTDATRVLDLRVSQRMNLTQTVRLEVFGDVFNALNDGAVVSRNLRMNSSLYDAVYDVVQPRTFRLGAKLSF